MPRITKVYPHALGTDVAAQRIKAAIEREKKEKSTYATLQKEHWVNDHEMQYAMKVYGYPIDGHLLISDKEVTVELNLPVIAMLAKGMIEDQLSQEIGGLLS
ncbi:MAG: polyhydroxyalkanoic acid system family protein [Planctomycetia bacterium]|nr:polyhydroxyalkanoic acid system family protein [Planctomycetia bacterium]